MSTSKKTKSKTVKSPAPATKSVVPKPAAKKKPAAVAPRVVVKPAPVPKPKPVVSKPVRTTISAQVDVGFGNALFMRGEGAGLSWDVGAAMECVSANLWRIVLPESAHGHTFKFLANDLTWSLGEDYSAANGVSVTFSPEF